MSEIEKLSIALTADLAAEVRAAVEKGEYASASEVIRDALRHWSLKRQGAARIRQLWDEGIASGIAEERRPVDQVIADGRRRLAQLKKKA